MTRGYDRLVVPLALGGVVVVCALIYVNVFLHQSPPTWDEAHHMVLGWQIWSDLVDRETYRLLKHSHAQFYWSFLHAWWVAGFLTAFGVTDFAARVSSFVAMIASIVLVFFVGRALLAERVPWTGLVAVASFLGLASLPILATLCMIELPATMVSFLAVLAYVRAQRTPTTLRSALFGCALGATFLMKYNFGLALIAAFGVLTVTESLFRREVSYGRDVAPALVPLLVVFLVWFVVPTYRLDAFLGNIANRPQGPQEGWRSVRFYPSVAYADAGGWAILFLAALLYAVLHLNDRVVRLLFCACVVYGGIIFAHQTRDTRHIYPLYPPLILLTAFAVTSGTRTMLRNAPGMRSAVLAVLLVAMLLRPILAVAHPRESAESERATTAIATRIADAVEGGQRVFVLGEFNALPAALIAWELRKRGDRTLVHQSMDHKEALEGINAFIPGAGKATADLRELQRVLQELSADLVVTLGVDETSPFHDEDYQTFNAWKQKYVDGFEGVTGYEKVASWDFASVGVSGSVFRATR